MKNLTEKQSHTIYGQDGLDLQEGTVIQGCKDLGQQ
jgi:hypothetical protein